MVWLLKSCFLLKDLETPKIFQRKWLNSTNSPQNNYLNKIIMTLEWEQSSQFLSWQVHWKEQIKPWMNQQCLSEPWEILIFLNSWEMIFRSSMLLFRIFSQLLSLKMLIMVNYKLKLKNQSLILDSKMFLNSFLRSSSYSILSVLDLAWWSLAQQEEVRQLVIKFCNTRWPI